MRWRGDRLEIRVHAERTLPAVDRSGADLLHALGALLENVVLTLEQLDFEPGTGQCGGSRQSGQSAAGDQNFGHVLN